MKYFVKVDDEEFVIVVNNDNQITVNEKPHNIDFRTMPRSGVTSLLIDNHSLEAVVEEKEGAWQVLIRGDLYEVAVDDERSRRLASARGDLGQADGDISVRSPMPGIVISVAVIEGQNVSKGETVIILESMKMENELRAPRDGVVSHVNVEEGANVEKNQILVMITD